MITGVNHITLSIKDAEESFAFYTDVLVAAQLGIHPETIRNWMRRPEFKAMLAFETKAALETLRNINSQTLLTQIQCTEKCEQFRA